MHIISGRWLAPAAALAAVAACAPPTDQPGDDPFLYDVDTSVEYAPRIGQPRRVVPSPGLPARIRDRLRPANNNVDIILFGGRLFMAWRNGQTHFASPRIEMHVVSSADGGQTWDFEHTIAVGADVREPRFMAWGGRLYLHFFEAGTLPTSFSPKGMWRIRRLGPARWTEREAFGGAAEVPWRIKVRRGRAYMTSYRGTHHFGAPAQLELLFSTSGDGTTWRPVDPQRPVVYRGGVSEAAFELDEQGGLWAVTRNEDGDSSGFGSHVCHAPPGALARWSCSTRCDPERYDSPWMFRHGDDLYLVARRDVGGPFDQGLSDLSFEERRTRYLLAYSTRPKRTALYRIDRAARAVRHVVDLPGVGDTAFPSVRRTGPHSFLIANYTSPLDHPGWSWLEGQTAAEGTQIYLLELEFVPAED